MGGVRKDYTGEGKLLKIYGANILSKAVRWFTAKARHCTIEELELKCKEIKGICE